MKHLLAKNELQIFRLSNARTEEIEQASQVASFIPQNREGVGKVRFRPKEQELA